MKVLQVEVCQKTVRFCKAIILQLKQKQKNKKCSAVCPILNRFPLSATFIPFSGLSTHINLSQCGGVVLPSPHLTKTGVILKEHPGRGVNRDSAVMLTQAALEDQGPDDNRDFKSHPVQKKTWPHKTGAPLGTSLVVPR